MLLSIKKLFNRGVGKLTNRPVDTNGNVIKTLYHGSVHKLNPGDFLECNTNFNSDTTKQVNCVFATTSVTKAKYFGLVNAVRGPGRSKLTPDRKIYVEHIRAEVLPEFYIYSVDGTGFELDAREEYMRNANTRITDVKTISVLDEINHGWEFYLVAETDRNLSVQEHLKQFNDFIKSGNFTRIDVEKLINEQENKNE